MGCGADRCKTKPKKSIYRKKEKKKIRREKSNTEHYPPTSRSGAGAGGANAGRRRGVHAHPASPHACRIPKRWRSTCTRCAPDASTGACERVPSGRGRCISCARFSSSFWSSSSGYSSPRSSSSSAATSRPGTGTCDGGGGGGGGERDVTPAGAATTKTSPRSLKGRYAWRVDVGRPKAGGGGGLGLTRCSCCCCRCAKGGGGSVRYAPSACTGGAGPTRWPWCMPWWSCAGVWRYGWCRAACVARCGAQRRHGASLACSQAKDMSTTSFFSFARF
jgi:hypothetical protein